MVHRLKTFPWAYDATAKGLKTFELRLNDRNYQVGDILILERNGSAYIQKPCVSVEVLYVLDDSRFLQKGYVAMSIRLCS
jgi:hypothetical protein